MGHEFDAMRATFSLSVRGRPAPACEMGSGVAGDCAETAVEVRRPAVRPAPVRLINPRLLADSLSEIPLLMWSPLRDEFIVLLIRWASRDWRDVPCGMGPGSAGQWPS